MDATKAAQSREEGFTPRSPLLLHHVALGARDVEHVAAFYREVFGLKEVARHLQAGSALRSIWLDLGGAVLMVEHCMGQTPLVQSHAPGPFLLAFSLAAQQLPAFEAALVRWGVVLEASTQHSRYFRDPEGNRVALSDHPLAGVRA
jgi:catechol 2,3-dioxygenase-like lactoylglutathione lyase family enzyme